MTICRKRHDELIEIIKPWYELTWSDNVGLSSLEERVRETFEVSRHRFAFDDFFSIYISSII